jgi:hypothetical protein
MHISAPAAEAACKAVLGMGDTSWRDTMKKLVAQ